MRPLISVIIPCYQAEKTIAGAVRSALAQTYDRLEVIVVDDGSTDGTRSKLAHLEDPRLRVICQANAGTAQARNRALDVAHGEYVAFLDADDRWLPTRLAADLAVLERVADPVSIVYGWFYAVDDRGRLLNRSREPAVRGDIFEAFIESENFLLPSVCLFHRDVFAEIGTFDPRHFHEDHEFALRATKRFRAYPSEQRLTVYRQAMDGKCRRILRDFDAAYAEELSIVDSIAPLLDTEQRGHFRQNQLRSLLYRFLMYGFNGSAKRLLPEVALSLAGGPKGKLTRLYAATGINLFPLLRSVIQTGNRFARASEWKRFLKRAGLDLAYDDAPGATERYGCVAGRLAAKPHFQAR
jgi:glycosyltransferase involved in cell wall biosynthesis